MRPIFSNSPGVAPFERSGSTKPRATSVKISGVALISTVPRIGEPSELDQLDSALFQEGQQKRGIASSSNSKILDFVADCRELPARRYCVKFSVFAEHALLN